MSISIDIAHLEKFRWVRISGALPVDLCSQLIGVLKRDLGVPVDNPERWAEYGQFDGVPLWGHQAQWDIRQHPNLHAIWSRLYGTEKLHVTLDSCRFTPPAHSGYAEPYGIHWDHNPWDISKQAFQGVLALTDTAPNQGGGLPLPFHRSSMTVRHGRKRPRLIPMAMKTGSPIPREERLCMCRP